MGRHATGSQASFQTITVYYSQYTTGSRVHNGRYRGQMTNPQQMPAL